MKKIEINLTFQFGQLEELSQEDQILIQKAIEATDKSYAKYSNFHVGAAIRLSNGLLFLGANQENAAYPVGLCAERTAIFAAQVQYPEQAITSLAIAARNDKGFLEKPITPCGSCRQVMLEVEQRYGKPIRILLYGTAGVYIINGTEDLMPLSFIGDNL